MITENKLKLMISEEDNFRIESICKRLKGSVSIVDIINWLKNFKTFEVNKALSILEKLEFVSENEIIEFYDIQLKEILSKTEDDIILHPVSEYGKSSTLMVYYFKKTPTFKESEKRIDFYFHYTNFKHKLKNIRKNTSIIFLDDFSGSGNQFNNYYKTFIKPQISINRYIKELFFLTLFYLPRAKKYIQNKHPEINLYGEVRNPVFLSNKSVFGYRNSMLPIRDFCYKYGEGLFTTYNLGKNIEETHPLGYNNSQALIVFAYNVPNNTLPIIWSNKNWIPLYPRVPNLKISKSKDIRKELAHEIGLIKNSEIANVLYSGEKNIGWKTINFITKTDFVIYSIIKMLKQKRTIPVICQILGITENDYNNYINEKNDIFTDNTTLTDYGNEIYLEIKNQLKIVKKEISKNNLSFEINDSKYLPKNFKGVT